MNSFRQVSNLLKKHFPEYKVSIRRVVVPKDTEGDCRILSNRRNKKEFLIRISRNLNEEAAILFLLHEVSHVLTWNTKGDDHGIEWGKAYSLVYRIYLKNWIEKEE